jgi:hypothetical protein
MTIFAGECLRDRYSLAKNTFLIMRPINRKEKLMTEQNLTPEETPATEVPPTKSPRLAYALVAIGVVGTAAVAYFVRKSAAEEDSTEVVSTDN